MKLCKIGIHDWPRGIKTIDDWLDCEYGDDEMTFIA
ncbi:unnamed protein product, partial [marine sediment metagenome]